MFTCICNECKRVHSFFTNNNYGYMIVLSTVNIVSSQFHFHPYLCNYYVYNYYASNICAIHSLSIRAVELQKLILSKEGLHSSKFENHLKKNIAVVLK